MWDAASQLVQENNDDPHDLLKKKAQSQVDRNDVLAAATTYEEVGEYSQAIDLLGAGGWDDRLYNLVETYLTEKHEKLIIKCIEYFKKHGKMNYAVETAKKLSNVTTLLQIYLDAQNWEEAFKIGDSFPQYHEQIYLPYGNWLAMNDRYDEAQEYYTKAGRPEDAIKVLKFLASNSVTQNSFKRAACYYQSLSRDIVLQLSEKTNISQTLDKNEQLSLLKTYQIYAKLYYAYDKVYKFVNDPFTMTPPEHLMNTAKFILVYLLNNTNPRKISKTFTLYCLAKISFKLKCFKTCRFAYEKLMQIQLPLEWRDTIDLGAMVVRSKPMTDPEQFLIPCVLCGTVNPFINPKENRCVNCCIPFILSAHSFEVLPLIQFVPLSNISNDECQKLLQSEPALYSTPQNLFNFSELDISNDKPYKPPIFNREQLLQADPQSVFIRKYKCSHVPDEYYIKRDSSANIVMCDNCQQFFYEEEWNYQVLITGRCSFCTIESKIAG
jgi:intraflagellar transport protein 122